MKLKVNYKSRNNIKTSHKTTSIGYQPEAYMSITKFMTFTTKTNSNGNTTTIRKQRNPLNTQVTMLAPDTLRSMVATSHAKLKSDFSEATTIKRANFHKNETKQLNLNNSESYEVTSNDFSFPGNEVIKINDAPSDTSGELHSRDIDELRL